MQEEIHWQCDGTEAESSPGGSLRLLIPEGSETREVRLSGRPGERLSRVIWLSDALPPRPLCSGLGRCGRCRVRWLSAAPEPLPRERELFSAGDLAEGWRLACQRQLSDREVPLLALPPQRIRPAEKARGTLPAGHEAVLAVDLGTTSLAWRALDFEDGRVLAEGEELNPQAGAGSDVVSRISLALDPGGRKLLARRVRDRLRQILSGLGFPVRETVLAGNTAMTEIFLDRDVSGLAAFPWRLADPGNERVVLPDLPPLYVPPLPAPFVGGDISAGLLTLRDAPSPFLLTDLGTNGEMALWTGSRLLLTSVPLGPALEGMGLECGALAGPDTVTDVQPGPGGLVLRTARGGVPAQGARYAGISATGCLSFLHLARRTGLMDEEGHFQEGGPLAASPLGRRLLACLDRSFPVPRFQLGGGLWLSLADIETVLKVRAAVAAGLGHLLAAAGLSGQDLACVAVAGALGRHLRPGILEDLGFVPQGTGAKVRALGNSSLEGACLLALHPESRGELARFCAGASVLEPARDPRFQQDYLSAMRFAPLRIDREAS